MERKDPRRNNNERIGQGVRRAPSRRERREERKGPARRENQQQKIDRIFRVIDTTIHERRGIFQNEIYGTRWYAQNNLDSMARSMAQQMGFNEGDTFHKGAVVDLIVEREFLNAAGESRVTYAHQYFRAERGMNADDIAKDIIRDVMDDDKYEDELDNYETRIVSYKIGDELPDEFDDELIAYHQFKQQRFEQEFSMHKLQMRDFSCLYESLMNIYFKERLGVQRPKAVNEWVSFVMYMFMRESFDFQNVLMAGKIKESLQYFKRYYQIDVGVFNSYHCKDELASIIQLEKEDETLVPKYFLVYWEEHVFPVERPKLELITEYTLSKFSSFGTKNKMFCVIPRFFWALKNEFLTYMYALPEFKEQNEWTIDKIADRIDLAEFIAIVKCNRSTLRSASLQQTIQQNIKQLRHEEDAGDLNAMGRMLISYLQGQGKLKDPVKSFKYFADVMKRDRKIECFFTDANQSWVQEKIEARKKQFDNVGLAGIDIEACKDTSLKESSFIFRPYMISIYGRLMQIYQREDRCLATRLVDVNEVFVGIGRYDCISKFIEWLVQNCFIWTDHDLMSLKYKNPSQKSFPRLFNYLFAHNGFGFDYLYLAEKLHMRCKEFKLVGDSSNMKCMAGGGLFMYDFFLIYKRSLKVLAQTFFKGKEDLQKLETNDIELSLEDAKQWCAEYERKEPSERLLQMIEYNRRDSIIVYRLAQEFFRFSFTTPFGHSFLPNMFYHSLSSLSWDMWQTCFLKSPIFVNKHTHEIEKKMKIGGLCLVYRHQAGIGLVIDFNSFYPSIMKNMMPLEYERFGSDSFEIYEEIKFYERDTGNWREEIKVHNIYKIKYSFPPDEKLPTIVQKGGDSLVIVSESMHFKEDDSGDAIYVFGETVRLAIEVGAKIRVFGQVSFKPGHVHKDFVDYMYNKRLQAKREDNAVQVQFYKDVMNMCFGKHGQNTYQQSKFGVWSSVREWKASLMMRDDVIHDSIHVKRILTDEVPLFEVKYDTIDQELNHKGATLRISAFIMEMARTHLMRVKHKLAQIVGADSICYCDTDSVMIALDKCEPVANQMVQSLLQQYKNLEGKHKKEKEEEFVKDITEIICETDSYQKILNLKVKDVTNLTDEGELPLIDNDRLGACKIEKLMINGIFMGQKQYGVRYIEGNKIKEAVKAKGIPDKYRDMLLVDRMLFATDEEGNVVPPIVSQEVTQFRRAGAGVNIFPMMKIIKSTLYKRDYDFIDRTSMPWQNIEVYEYNKKLISDKGELLKEKFKELHAKTIEIVKMSEEYIAAKESEFRKRAINKEVKAVMNQEWLRVVESRKRFMLQLPKYKYDRLQDKLLQVMVEDEGIKHDIILYLLKLKAIGTKSIILRKKSYKKDEAWWVVNEDFRDGHFESIYNNEHAGTIIAFTLFCHWVAQKKGLNVTDQFQKVCMGLSQLVQNFVNNQHAPTPWWRDYILYGLQFLAAPISVEGDERLLDLDQHVRTTSLWRFMTNVMNYHIEQSQKKEEDMIVQDVDMDEVLKVAPIHKAQYDERFSRYSFVLDVPLDENGKPILQEVLYDEEQKGGNLIEDRVNFNQYRELQVYERPILEQVDLAEENEYYAQRSKYVAKSLIHQLYSCNKEVYNQDEIKGFVDEIFLGFKSKQADEVKKYFSIFEIRAKGVNTRQLTAMDVIDYILVCQFLYIGGDRACKVFRTFIDEWKSYVNQYNSTIKIFKSVSELIFQRPQMFGSTLDKGKKECVAKIVNLVESLYNKVIYYNFGAIEIPEYRKDAILRNQIEDIIADKSICTNDFRALFRKACYDKESVAYLFGERMSKRIILWSDPDDVMKECLQNILFIGKSSMIKDSGNNELLEKEQQQQLMLQNLQKIKEGTEQFRTGILDKHYFEQREREIIFQDAFQRLKQKDFIPDAEMVNEANRIQSRMDKQQKKMYDYWNNVPEQFLDYEEMKDDYQEQDHWLIHDEQEQYYPGGLSEIEEEVDMINQEVEDEQFYRMGKRLREVLQGEDYDSQEDSMIMRHEAKRQRRFYNQEKRIAHFIEAEAEEGEEENSLGVDSISDFILK